MKQSLLAAKSIAFSAGASGVYLVGMFQKLGIYDQMKAKQVAVTPDKPVGEVVARGEAEIGLHQMSELLPIKGIEIVGPLPPGLQQVTLFSGGVVRASTNPAAAAALVKFLTAPAVLPVLARHGLDPG